MSPHTKYIHLPAVPPTPSQSVPRRNDCTGYEFISMVQLCNIAEAHGLTRRARAAYVGNRLRKYVLVSAVVA